jgi:levansucrase
MTTRRRRRLRHVAWLPALLSLLLSGPAVAATYPTDGDFTAVWSRAQALKVQLDPTNTKPLIEPDFPIMSDKVWLWDTWPLTNLDAKPVKYHGWHIIFSLVAPRSGGFPERHTIATVGYFYSRDGASWTYGGTVFPAGTALGSRQWAGSAVLAGDQVNLFYTASGKDHPAVNDPNDFLQRVALATATLKADDSGVWFAGKQFRDSRIVAEADGKLYQTYPQSQGGPIIYAFRDPFVFRDPADGQIYMTFEGNTAGYSGTHACTPAEVGPVPPGHVVPPDSRFYTGNIGLARARGTSLRKWKLLHPLVSANCVNQQTERPHFVIKDGRYYLFTISHQGTFAPGLSGPDGLYGFVGDALRSSYRPLNGSALVLGNPPEAPKQQYSEYVMPNWLVEAFIETVPTPTGDRFGGTLAPTLRLQVDGAETALVERLGFGVIP